MHDGPAAFRFELAGDLNREGASRLDQDWRTASSALGDRKLIVDMTFVTGVDEAARALIIRWHQEGAQFIASSRESRALVESIFGQSFPEQPANARPAAVSDLTWLPFRSSLRWRAVTLFFIATIVVPPRANAETVESKMIIDASVRANAEQVRRVTASRSNESSALTRLP
jgi:hypothetical protein